MTLQFQDPFQHLQEEGKTLYQTLSAEKGDRYGRHGDQTERARPPR